MRRCLPLLLLAIAAACQDAAITQPSADPGAMAASLAPACPLAADVVVGDELALRNAVAGALPGQVIGLDGMIGLTGGALTVWTDDVTLTCATPGAGLYVAPGPLFGYLVRAFAQGVTVDRLVLDATGTSRGAYWASYDGIGVFGAAVRFSNNTVVCGPGECAFFTGTANAIIVDNYFESPGSLTGVHLQRLVNALGVEYDVDGSIVRGNTVLATGPAPPDPLDRGPIFGGIRPRDGRNVIIADNIVEGPWTNSLSLQHVNSSQIERNLFEGAVSFGIATSLSDADGHPDWDRVNDNVFRNNRVTGAGGPAAPSISGGAVFYYACGNTLLGNNLNGNYQDMGAAFHPYSGANTLVGNQNVVLDGGAWDCDGDGAIDPNIITGRGARRADVKLGPIISKAASTTGGQILR